jgi:hypothetical protein
LPASSEQPITIDVTPQKASSAALLAAWLRDNAECEYVNESRNSSAAGARILYDLSRVKGTLSR